VAPASEDLAFALEYVVPFRGDDECIRWLRYPAPPNRVDAWNGSPRRTA
jgi:hypothetical protein